MTATAARPLTRLAAGLLLAVALADARAEESTDNTSPYGATARLDFTVTIGKFLYFRVGGTGATVDTVGFTLTPSIPSAGTPPVAGNNHAVAGSGTPGFTVAASNNALPVAVQSNAGTVSLRATVLAPLSNGSLTIPMNAITLASSDALLPAPVLPASGTGTPVTVTGTAFSNLVTQRSATWTFALGGSAAGYRAGTYSGQVQFTASAP